MFVSSVYLTISVLCIVISHTVCVSPHIFLTSPTKLSWLIANAVGIFTFPNEVGYFVLNDQKSSWKKISSVKKSIGEILDNSEPNTLATVRSPLFYVKIDRARMQFTAIDHIFHNFIGLIEWIACICQPFTSFWFHERFLFSKAPIFVLSINVTHWISMTIVTNKKSHSICSMLEHQSIRFDIILRYDALVRNAAQIFGHNRFSELKKSIFFPSIERYIFFKHHNKINLENLDWIGTPEYIHNTQPFFRFAESHRTRESESIRIFFSVGYSRAYRLNGEQWRKCLRAF